MIDVEQITIDVRVPSDEVRIVAMQPFIQMHSPTEEPFRWSNVAVASQLAAIGRTLDVAQRGFGGRSANFTLFPEYAVPGIAGAAIINDRITANEWPNDTIIIAGIHGIDKNDYRNLCETLAAHVSHANAPDSVPDDRWVNCCVIWIKDHVGTVAKWVQPKVRPAWPEMNVPCNDMFNGSTVYVFQCQYEGSRYPCRFATLVCFDWVASVGGSTVCEELLTRLNESWNPTPRPLHWIFVIQHNPRPNHPSFLNSTYRFLTNVDAHPFVERDKAIVVHANTAVSSQPARTGLGGFSACVFSPSSQFDTSGCRPTVCMQPSSLRANNILERCKDVVFREMGECIHAFTVRVPRFVTPDATDRTYPLPLAHVHASYDSTDPRLSGGPVAASVKWMGDSLDNVHRVSANALSACALHQAAEALEPSIIDAKRTPDGHAAANQMNWAACSFSHGKESRDERRHLDVDLWGTPEAEALEHLLHSLTSLGLAYDLDLHNALLHGAVEIDGGFVQVVAIRGDTHQDCRLHYDKCIPHQATDPVMVIARDHDNLIPTPEEFLRIDETGGEGGLRFLDYQTLVTNCRVAADREALKRQLDGFTPRHRRII